MQILFDLPISIISLINTYSLASIALVASFEMMSCENSIITIRLMNWRERIMNLLRDMRKATVLE